jgi:hypothetical protein
MSRNGDVLHDAGKIDESKIDELAAFGLDVSQNFFGGAFLHGSSCMGCDRENPPGRVTGWTLSPDGGSIEGERESGSQAAFSHVLPFCERMMNEPVS